MGGIIHRGQCEFTEAKFVEATSAATSLGHTDSVELMSV